MNRIKALLKDIAREPGPYVMLLILIVVVLGAIYVLLASSAEHWRWMYCTANEARSIECTAKGWW